MDLKVNIPDFGKIPPQSIDMEEAVLGAMLIDFGAVFDLLPILKEEAFYKEANKKIFRTIKELSSKEIPIDTLTITEELRSFNNLESIGGPVYLSQLTSKVVSSANSEYHARIIMQKYLQRELIRVSTDIQSKAFDDSIDIADLLDFSENMIFQISQVNIKNDPIRLNKCIDDVLIEIGKIYYKEKELIGIPSGFTGIDRKTGGFQKGNLVIIAARPSMGKTALAQVLSENMARLKYPVVFFTQEMSNNELTIRHLSGVTGYSNMKIKSAEIDYDLFCHQAKALMSYPIFLDETQNLTIYELRSKVKKLILKEKIQAVIVDYLQLMRGEGKSREQEVSFVSRNLKGIAKEFNIPVIALSQLNREVESRATKRPQLADLRESGSIEQDADIVCFMYRPSLYGFKDIDIGSDHYDSQGLIVVDCAKHRNGPIFTLPLFHNECFSVIKEDKNEITESSQLAETGAAF